MSYSIMKNLNRRYGKAVALLALLLTVGLCSTEFHRTFGNHFVTDEMGKGVEEHHGCIAKNKPNNKPSDYLSSKNRLLQLSNPHGLRMVGSFEIASNSLNINLDFLKQLFAISAKYFEKTIKVTTLTGPDDTKHPFPSCGSILVPELFKSTGFDQQTTDLLVFVRTYDEPNQNVLAFAGPCEYVRRPTYGRMFVNGANFITNQLQFAGWHRNVETIIHQFTHILGFLSGFFGHQQTMSQFFTTPTSQTRLLTSQVLKANPGNSDQFMLILPDVKQYVQNLFGCSQANGGVEIGGLLQIQFDPETLDPLPGSHWFTPVYYREMMLPAASLGGNRITGLTMSLIKGTGWYAEVDNTILVETTVFGKNRGCNFALGLSSPQPEYCNQQETVDGCDFQSINRGRCGTTSFSTFSVCNDQNQVIPRTIDVTGSGSRCIESASTSYCLQAQCVSPTQVRITVAEVPYTCTQGGSATVTTSSGLVLNCPSNYETFCSIDYCPGWCIQQGFCVQGVCHPYNCPLYISSCNLCSTVDLNEYICQECAVGFTLANNKCTTTNCAITNCATCTIDPDTTEICVSCDPNYLLAQTGLSCTLMNMFCNSDCRTCNNNAMTPVCTACNNNKVPAGPNTNNCINPVCSADCTTLGCVANQAGTAAICTACRNSKVPTIPQTINCMIPSCSTSCKSGSCQANIAGTQSICSACNSGLIPDGSNGCISPVCDTNCRSGQCVANTAGTLPICNACNSNKVPSGSLCVAPTCNPDCRTGFCNANANGMTSQCDACINGKISQANLDSCILPVCGSGCTNCQPNPAGNAPLCVQCSGILVPSGQGCVNPAGLCGVDCQTCSANALNTAPVCTLCTNMKVLTNPPSINCVNPDCSLIVGCRTCGTDNGITSVCQACNSGLTLSANKLSCVTSDCTSIDARCLICQDSDNSGTEDQCVSCSEGYIVSNDGLSCVIDCSSLIFLCSQCSGNPTNPSTVMCNACDQDQFRFSNGTCTTCSRIGFYKDLVNRSCLPCNAACTMGCDGPAASDCSSCPNGQGILGFNVCQPCSQPNCKKCFVSQTYCVECFDGSTPNRSGINVCP